MSYGVEVFDSSGRTVFNSTHPTELTLWSGEITTATQAGPTAALYGGGGGGVSPHKPLPDYCFGSDNTVFATAVTRATLASAPSATTPAAGWTGSSGFTGTLADNEVLMDFISDADNTARVGARMIYNYVGISYFISALVYGRHWRVVNGLYESDNQYAYVKWSMTTDLSSINSTVLNTSISNVTTKDVSPTIWVRPKSSSYQGRFGILFGDAGRSFGSTSYAVPLATSALDNLQYNRGIMILTDQSGSNVFEVKVTVPASDWGTALSTRTLKYAAGSANTYGIESYTDDSFQHHSASTAESWTTYSSLTRPAKVYSAVGLVPETSITTASTTMINVANNSTYDTNKNYCRMNGSAGVVNFTTTVSGVSGYHAYTYMYQWWANRSIAAQWKMYPYQGNGTIHTPTIIFDTYGSKQLYAIADFGEPK